MVILCCGVVGVATALTVVATLSEVVATLSEVVATLSEVVATLCGSGTNIGSEVLPLKVRDTGMRAVTNADNSVWSVAKELEGRNSLRTHLDNDST